ncbi:MAG: TIGR00730 family Rossman fold protein [Waddliaceae bacterium]
MNDDKDKIFGTDSWRVFRIIAEFVEGFETLTEIGPSVSIFGSGRLRPDSPYYPMGVHVAQKIAKRGFAIITGGGPGIMEAANKGAQTAKGISCGIGIDIQRELEMNPYVDPSYQLRFRYFFVRKVMFVRYAKACVFLPGGLGTMDELFEAMTLIQTEKIHPFPIFLMGQAYWRGLKQWLTDEVLRMGCMEEKDLDLIRITDDPEEVAQVIEQHCQQDRSKQNF